mgnify:FL=1
MSPYRTAAPRVTAPRTHWFRVLAHAALLGLRMAWRLHRWRSAERRARKAALAARRAALLTQVDQSVAQRVKARAAKGIESSIGDQYRMVCEELDRVGL